MERKRNNKNNPVMQALTDLRNTAVAHNNIDLVNAIDTAIKCTSQNEMNDAGDKFRAHNYPDRNITWSRRSKYWECPAVFELSEASQMLINFLCANVNKDNHIQFTRQDIVTIFGWSESKVKRCMKELKANGFLATIIEPSGRTGGIYMPNPILDATGRHVKPAMEEFRERVSATALMEFHRLNKTKRSDTSFSKLRHADDTVTSYAQLLPYNPDTKKEPSDTATSSKSSANNKLVNTTSDDITIDGNIPDDDMPELPI